MDSTAPLKVPDNFKVVALLAVRNESDIIETSVGDLVGQEIGVYLIDDHSTDGTIEALSRFGDGGVIGIENQPDADVFSLQRMMRRKEELAQELDADWFINHDADEFRESPWPHLNLREAIYLVDCMGFTAIDFEVLDFWPTHDDFMTGDDPRQAFPFFAPSAAANKLQVRCWKRLPGSLDLASSGGHEAVFAGRRVFPIRFLLRHYPFRGQRHGEAKLHGDRRARYAIEEREDGWHRQHDGIEKGASFIRDPRDLRVFDPLEVRLQLWLNNRRMEQDAGKPDAIELDEQSQRREAALLGRELHARNLEAESLHRDLDARNRDLEQAEGRAAALGRELRARDLEAERSHRDLEQAEGRAAALARELEALHLELNNRERGLVALQAEVTALRCSWSWQLTAPLRAVLKGIRGR